MENGDIKLDNNNDIMIENGDFVISDADQQNLKLIIQAQKGQFYETPLIGVGIGDEMNSVTTFQNLKNRIKNNMALDGYDADGIMIDDDFNITTNAKRTRK